MLTPTLRRLYRTAVLSSDKKLAHSDKSSALELYLSATVPISFMLGAMTWHETANTKMAGKVLGASLVWPLTLAYGYVSYRRHVVAERNKRYGIKDDS